jgi:hypothetical protein
MTFYALIGMSLSEFESVGLEARTTCNAQRSSTEALRACVIVSSRSSEASQGSWAKCRRDERTVSLHPQLAVVLFNFPLRLIPLNAMVVRRQTTTYLTSIDQKSKPYHALSAVLPTATFLTVQFPRRAWLRNGQALLLYGIFGNPQQHCTRSTGPCALQDASRVVYACIARHKYASSNCPLCSISWLLQPAHQIPCRSSTMLARLDT